MKFTVGLLLSLWLLAGPSRAQDREGYTPPPGASQAYMAVYGVASNADGLIGSLPANDHIASGSCREVSTSPGNNVSVAFGSTSGASDVASAFAIAANKTTDPTAEAFAKVWFSASAPQQIFVSSASWGSAIVDCFIFFNPGP